MEKNLTTFVTQHCLFHLLRLPDSVIECEINLPSSHLCIADGVEVSSIGNRSRSSGIEYIQHIKIHCAIAFEYIFAY